MLTDHDCLSAILRSYDGEDIAEMTTAEFLKSARSLIHTSTETRFRIFLNKSLEDVHEDKIFEAKLTRLQKYPVICVLTRLPHILT